jgi:signal transduction histidine kinase
MMFGYSTLDNIENKCVFIIRLVSLTFAALLLTHETYTSSKNIKWLWVLTLWIGLPFTSFCTYMIYDYQAIWLAHLVIMTLVLAIFSNLFYFVVLNISAAIAAYFTYTILIHIYGVFEIASYSSKEHIYGVYSSIILLAILLYIFDHNIKRERKKNKQLQTLSRSVAHEVGEPLSIALIEAQLIEEALIKGDYEEAKRYLVEQKEVMKHGVQSTQMILESIKDSNAQLQDMGSYSIAEVVRSTLDTFHTSVKNRKKITFKNSTKDFIFLGSKILVINVLYNLLKNSIKYAGSNTNIEIWLDDKELHFKDNGNGIDDHIKDKLFKQHVTTDGYGVGLSFCSVAMNKMNGSIRCVSEKGAGAEFILTFDVPHKT